MFGRKKIKSKKKRWRRRILFLFKTIKWMIILLPFVALLSWWYIHHLNKWVESQFTASHKWDIPSRIYSDIEYLYPGTDIKLRKIEAKINRLGYRKVTDSIKNSGEYLLTTKTLDIYLHNFQYPFESVEGFPARLTLNGASVARMTNLKTNETIPLIKLEPELIASIFDEKMEDRTLITLQEAPPHLLQAIILIEDIRFFRHKGVDPQGILRAMIKNILSFRVVQGGSTLTQQLVKNYFVGSDRTIARKIKEAINAMLVERHHGKDEILEAYLNEIYLGQRGASSISGFGEGARFYFGKSVDQLTLGEQALLAGMTRSPRRYSPYNNLETAYERRNFVLASLYETGLITKEEYSAATSEKIILPKKQTATNVAPYFIDFVKYQLREFYPEEILSSQGLNIFTTLDMTDQLAAEEAVVKGLEKLEQTYAKRLPKKESGQLQGALISLQPQSGYIRAMVGGRNYGSSQFNRAYQAKRQPGSIFKPFVYLTAFDPAKSAIMASPAMIIEDATFSMQSGGEEWSPMNYDKKEHGLVSLRESLKQSYNIATAKLAIATGLDEVVKTARQSGITTELKAVPSLALGAFEVTPIEMASAYSIFPNGGIRAEPISIINVMMPGGKVLEKKSIEMKRIFPQGPVYLTTSILKDVMETGTAASSRALGFKGIAAGKTGTTSNYRDAWFAGFTPDHLALVWVGYDDNDIMNLSGSSAALPIWVHYMTSAIPPNLNDFPSPSGIILIKIDPQSGEIATPNCPEAQFQPFLEGQEPNKKCSLDHRFTPSSPSEKFGRH